MVNRVETIELTGWEHNEVEKEFECTIVKRVDTFFKEKYLRTVA